MGAAAIPLIISAVGAGATAINQRNMKNEQNDIAAAGVQKQNVNQREADAEIAQGVGKLEHSSPDESRKQATGAFLDQLRRTRGQAIGETPLNGSDEYSQGIAGANSDVAGYGREQADIQGRINAPGLQRQAEGVNAGRTVSRLGTIGRNSSADQFLTEMRLRGVNGNPALEYGGAGLSAIGNGMASSGFGGGTGVAPPKRTGLPPSAFNVPRN